MWPAYVINLAANADRLQRSGRQLDAQGIAWQRIDGVNGWTLPSEEVARVYDARRNARSAKHPLVPPEIGCYLSHIAAWRSVAEGTAPGGAQRTQHIGGIVVLEGIGVHSGLTPNSSSASRSARRA